MADTAEAPTNQQTENTAPAMSGMDSILATLKPIAKFKVRSYETSKDVHIPLLQSLTKDNPGNGPTVVLLGDSMIERMITTGGTPNLAPWPSPAMFSDELLAEYQMEDGPPITRLDGVFNAGVGGDKIQNVAYRLVGDEERGLPGLLPMLAQCGTVKVWVVHVGTNNLSAKHGLGFENTKALEVLIEALLSVSPKVLVTGLFDRKDMPPGAVWQANDAMKGVGNVLMDRCGSRVLFIPRPLEFKMDEHLEDHVHLNLDGYRLWVENLFMSVVAALNQVSQWDWQPS
jgi:platelet-activating factor acetylhydrolase IB subunit beta/gamma